jgi:methionyl-tRNA formyltransferase
MSTVPADAPDGAWRVVIFSNVPRGIVYHLVEETLAPLGHRIVGVVTTPGPPKRRSTGYLDVVAAVPPGIDVIVANHPRRLAAMIAPMRPDLIISGGFPYLIPPEVVELPRLGAINMHPALLPKYRGPSPIEWHFRNGEPELGFTIHRIASEFDNGPILAQMTEPIHDDDVFETLLARIESTLPTLLHRALERVARGEIGEPQDESQASYAGMLEPEWRTIDWAQPARTVHNQVRSWYSFGDDAECAIGQVDGETLRVVRTRLVDRDNAGECSARAGDLLKRTPDCLTVQCGDGPIDIIAWASVPG